jgi:hypothetical protein
MTDQDKGLSQIIPEWVTTGQLGGLLGVKGDTIKHRIARGLYKSAKKVEKGRGGGAWMINVYDENLPPEIAHLYEQQITAPQPQCFVSLREARMLRASLDRVALLLKELAERPK